jgi:hypothetical protein
MMGRRKGVKLKNCKAPRNFKTIMVNFNMAKEVDLEIYGMIRVVQDKVGYPLTESTVVKVLLSELLTIKKDAEGRENA